MSAKEEIIEKPRTIQEYSKHGYLDHSIRTVEEYILSHRIKTASGFSNEPYRITKRPTETLIKGCGAVYIFAHDATLKYSSKGDGMDKRFAIAHELGHLVLHYDADCQGGNSLFIRDAKKETEASFFAKELLNDQGKLVKKYEKLSESKIKSYCKDYDEFLLN